jgi:hypothetical protein
MQGWPEVAQAIKMIADQHLADIITVSLGDGESDFINDPTNPTASQQAAIHSLDPAFLDAAAHNVPVTQKALAYPLSTRSRRGSRASRR